MSVLLDRLVAMRVEVIDTMTAAVEADEDWHSWLPLLAQVEIAVRAVRIVDQETAQ